MSVTIGTATAATGETARGQLVVTELPTGPPERVPVAVVAGEKRATVETDHDGHVLGRRDGVAVYENGLVASLAVRDDGDLVVPRDGEAGD
jgi:hypothetical protein